MTSTPYSLFATDTAVISPISIPEVSKTPEPDEPDHA